MRIRKSIFAACLAAPLAIGCGGSSVENFEGYGVGMPGSNFAEGGEMLIERIDISPGLTPPEVEVPITVNQFHAFQYRGAFNGATIYPGAGDCFQIQHPNQFPVHEIGAGAEYVDWGDSITLNGPSGSVTVPKVTAPAEGMIDNRPSPGRNHAEGNFIYGGPMWQNGGMEGFEGGLQDFDMVSEGDYSIDVMDNGTARNIPFKFARSYDFPMGIGTDDGIAIPATVPDGGMEISWTEMLNPDTPHSYTHDFAFIAFASFPEEGDRGPTPTWVCFPPADGDGSITLSQELVDSLPDAGIIQAGRMTHYMDMFDNDGAPRRFDLFAIWCALSTYGKVAE